MPEVIQEQRRLLEAYESVIGRTSVSQLRQLARELRGASVVHVNSTRVGGGVAEILAWLVPLMEELGMRTSWEVIEGNEDFFAVTKAFHNGLQGKQIILSQVQRQVYEETVARNADRLLPSLRSADFVIIHDPQPAFLLPLCQERKGKWVWRCHIDASHPSRSIWDYLRRIVSGYDASVFSMPQFARRLPHPQFIIAPSIDPLSPKNVELSKEEIEETLQQFHIDSNRPILTQISRFDRFKDPVGVIKAFSLLAGFGNAQLVLAGGGATDDPEGAAVLAEVHEAARSLGSVFVLLLPGDAHRTINALQRASTIVIQKSLNEGFGLTVTEAMWKSKPVIGGNTGGIRLQVFNHHTGYLVETPEGAALRIRELLRRPDRIQKMGAKAKRHVMDHFLLTRHLREYLTLMVGLKRGLTNYLMTEE